MATNIKKNTTTDVVEAVPLPSPRPERVNKISFDVFFEILQRRDATVLPHHKSPIARFLARIGKLNAQTLEWFEENYRRY